MYLCLNKEKKNLWTSCVYCIYTCVSNGRGVFLYFTGFLADYVICDHIPNLLLHCLLVFLMPPLYIFVIGFKRLFMIEKQGTLQLMPCERSFLEQKAIGIAMSLVGAYWRSGKHWCSCVTCVPQIETSCGNGSKLWASDGCVFWSSSERVEVNFKGLEGWKCLSSVLRWLKTGRRSASLQYPLTVCMTPVSCGLSFCWGLEVFHVLGQSFKSL